MYDNLDLAEENVVIGGEEEEIAEANGNKVTFDLGYEGAVGTPAEQDVSGLVAEPPKPSRDGYIFDGWYNGNAKWDFSQAATGAMTLTAHWTAKKLIITYHKQKETATAYDESDFEALTTKGEGYYDSLMAKPADPEWDGFLLRGWFKDKEATSRVYFTGDTYPASTTANNYKLNTANFTLTDLSATELGLNLYAAKNTVYRLTFMDGTKELQVFPAVVAGQKVAYTAPAKEGMTFTGWTVSGNYQKVITSAEVFSWVDSTAKSELLFDNLATLYTGSDAPTLVLTADYTPTTYTVTYNLVGVSAITATGVTYGGSDTVKTETVNFGGKAHKPTPTMSVTGTMVEGWYEDNHTNDPTKKFDFDAVVTGNHNLYPNVQVGWTVTYKTKSGKADTGWSATPVTDQVVDGAKATARVGENLDGAKFLGWYVANEAGTAPTDTLFDFNTPITKNVTLYAKYNTTNVTTKALTIKYVAKASEDSLNTTTPTYTNKTVYVVTGETAQLPSDIAEIKLDRHELDYWYNEENSNQKFVFGTTPVNEAKTVVAAYKAIEFTVSFQTNGGGTVADKKVAKGGTIASTDFTVSRGANYVAKPEWYTDAAFTTRFYLSDDTEVTATTATASTVTKDTTLFAKWYGRPYTVTLRVGTGATDAAKTALNGKKINVRYGTSIADSLADTTITAPASDAFTGKLSDLNNVAAEAGYTFDYWTKGDSTTEWSLTGDAITGETTLNAKFTGKTYTVKFETNGGTAVTSQAVAAGGHVDASKFLLRGDAVSTTKKAPVKEGYSFHGSYTGWYKDEALTQEVESFGALAISKDTTFYAGWEIAKFSVTYDYTGFDLDKVTAPSNESNIEYGKKATKPSAAAVYFYEDASHNFYKLLGWTTTPSGATYYDFETPVTKNTTLYPHFARANKVTFFKGNGTTEYTELAQYVVADGSSVATEPTGTGLNYAGATFVSWLDKAQSDPTAKAFDFTAPITAATSVYAKTSTTTTVQINFVGGSDSALQSGSSTLFIPKGTKLAESDAPVFTKEGNEFDGWIQEGQTTKFDFNEPITEATTTLNAQWKAAQRKVTYIVDGATWRETTVEHGAAFEALTAPSKTGYTFTPDAGWYTDAGLTAPAPATVTKDLTVYAKYTAQTFTVEFWKDASTQYTSTDFADAANFTFTSNKIAVAYGKAVEKLPTPKVTGDTKAFVAWFTDSGLTKQYDPKAVITGNVKLYAKFLNKVNITVTMDGWMSRASMFGPLMRRLKQISSITPPKTAL